MKKIFTTLLVCGGIFFCGCSSDDDEGGGTTILLSADKASINANNADAVTFKVTENGKDITASATILSSSDGTDWSPLAAPRFTTSTAGTWSFKAKASNTESNTVQVTASVVNSQDATISASKQTLYCDGGDFVVLTLKDKSGVDLTSGAKFFVDDNPDPIPGNRFSTTKSDKSSFTITAKYDGVPVESSIKIMKTTAFAQRMLFEEMIANWCPNCPAVAKQIIEVGKDSPRTVVCYCLHVRSSDIELNYYTQVTKDFTSQFIKYHGGESRVPSTYANHSPGSGTFMVDEFTANDLRNEAKKATRDVGISIESAVEGDLIRVSCNIGSKKTFKGKAVAVLIENGMNKGNSEYLFGEHVFRAYAPSFEGESISFTEGQSTKFETSFKISELSKSEEYPLIVDNCEIVVFVTDDADQLAEGVNYANVGEVKGY